MGLDEPSGDHAPHYLVPELLDFGYFMGCAEPIEKMDKRHSRFEGGSVRDERHVHGFLHIVG